MATETPVDLLAIGVRADLKQFRKDLAEIPGIGAKEAKDLAAGIRKGLAEAKAAAKEASAASKKAAEDNAKLAQTLVGEWKKVGAAAKTSAAATKEVAGGWSAAAKALQSNQLVSDLEQISAMFMMVGGSVSRFAAVVTSSIRPVALLTSTMGAAGVVALAIPLSFAASAGALKMVADGAVEAADRLKKFKVDIGSEAKGNLAAYSLALQDLSNAFDMVRVAMGSEIAFELAIWARLLRENVGTLVEWAKAVQGAASAASNWITLGLKPAIGMIGGALYGAITDTTRAKTELIAKTALYTERLKEVTKEAAKASDEIEKIAQADEAEGKRQQAIADEAERKRKAAATAHKAYVLDLQQAVEDGNKAMADAAKARRDYFAAEWTAHEQARIDSLNFDSYVQGLRDLSAEAEWTGTQIANMLSQETADQQKARLNEIRDAVLGMVSEIAGAIGDVFGEIANRNRDAVEDLKDANADLSERQRDAAQQIIDIREKMWDSTTAEQRAQYNAQIAGLQQAQGIYQQKMKFNADLAAQSRAQARRAFIAEKVAGAIQVGIQTSIAVMTALAQLGPIAGAFATAGIVAAGATQAGIILAKPLPEFPMGSVPMRGASPDHTDTVRKRRTEAILTERGVASAGGPDGVRALNQGTGGGGGAYVEVHIGGRVAGAATGEGRVRVDPRAGKVPRGRGRR